MKHIIYSYKGKVYESHKNWDFKHIEDILTRMGCTYWEIGL
jgi:hypothetical protein